MTVYIIMGVLWFEALLTDTSLDNEGPAPIAGESPDCRRLFFAAGKERQQELLFRLAKKRLREEDLYRKAGIAAAKRKPVGCTYRLFNHQPNCKLVGFLCKCIRNITSQIGKKRGNRIEAHIGSIFFHQHQGFISSIQSVIGSYGTAT